MNIQHRELQNSGAFYIEEGGEVLAEMVYSKPDNNEIVIEHTEVAEKLQGQSIGHEMVHRAVEYAREQNIKINPLCSFAKSVFDKEPDFRDVLV